MGSSSGFLEPAALLDGGCCIKFSIVTNALNQGKYLATPMSSVLAQDWPEVEYFVVDPGSTDHTREIIHTFQQRYPGRVVYINERDHGPADGLNKAFSLATGDWFGYLNADDFYLPGCFRAAAHAITKTPLASAVYADGYKANAEGKIVARVISTRFSAKKFVYGGALVLQQSTFYSAGAFRQVGGFNVENTTSWDAELLMQMALQSMRLVHVPGYWSVFRVHPDSITGSQRLALESRSTHARYFKTVMGRDRSAFDRALAKLVLAWTLLTEPRGLFMRISNRIGNSKIKLPSSKLEEGKNLAF